MVELWHESCIWLATESRAAQKPHMGLWVLHIAMSLLADVMRSMCFVPIRYQCIYGVRKPYVSGKTRWDETLHFYKTINVKLHVESCTSLLFFFFNLLYFINKLQERLCILEFSAKWTSSFGQNTTHLKSLSPPFVLRNLLKGGAERKTALNAPLSYKDSSHSRIPERKQH